jgi:hypothetical protein
MDVADVIANVPAIMPFVLNQVRIRGKVLFLFTTAPRRTNCCTLPQTGVGRKQFVHYSEAWRYFWINLGGQTALNRPAAPVAITPDPAAAGEARLDLARSEHHVSAP